MENEITEMLHMVLMMHFLAPATIVLHNMLTCFYSARQFGKLLEEVNSKKSHRRKQEYLKILAAFCGYLGVLRNKTWNQWPLFAHS